MESIGLAYRLAIEHRWVAGLVAYAAVLSILLVGRGLQAQPCKAMIIAALSGLAAMLVHTNMFVAPAVTLFAILIRKSR